MAHTGVCVVALVLICCACTVLEMLVLYFHELDHDGGVVRRGPLRSVVRAGRRCCVAKEGYFRGQSE